VSTSYQHTTSGDVLLMYCLNLPFFSPWLSCGSPLGFQPTIRKEELCAISHLFPQGSSQYGESSTVSPKNDSHSWAPFEFMMLAHPPFQADEQEPLETPVSLFQPVALLLMPQLSCSWCPACSSMPQIVFACCEHCCSFD